ncbi:tyrosine-type recombinase/integrase [Crossiella cryophila]|uniref:Site-specific recombinase XerD n=1 Tax=Crossiella cryophila TaxID=43355 RepID=A0A7W7CII4_9PSEU|nr:site-specific integrase [Crossiella cryophila]MBB4681850.1 site-specific recombinase XerD [Crossiella cryophila]
MTGHNDNPATAAQIEAARVVLLSMGITVEDLLGESQDRPPVPTFAEYIPKVSGSFGTGTARAYGPYLKIVERDWGDRRMDEVSPSEITAKREEVRRNAVRRRSTRGGHSAAAHFVSALRCLYKHLVDDELMSKDRNPALKVRKPAQPPGRRHGLQDARLAEINRVAVTTGDDPALDGLLLRLHTETACRRAGAMALRRCDLDPDLCLIQLCEKGDLYRSQPVSPTLMKHLLAHFEYRGDGDPSGLLLRYSNGKPLTRHRYDYLWHRLGKYLAWVYAQQISTHWLRHTTLTWVERNFGHAVARAFAGHSAKGDGGATSTYVEASLGEVAAALSAMTGEPHPLATEG